MSAWWIICNPPELLKILQLKNKVAGCLSYCNLLERAIWAIVALIAKAWNLENQIWKRKICMNVNQFGPGGKGLSVPLIDQWSKASLVSELQIAFSFKFLKITNPNVLVKVWETIYHSQTDWAF